MTGGHAVRCVRHDQITLEGVLVPISLLRFATSRRATRERAAVARSGAQRGGRRRHWCSTRLLPGRRWGVGAGKSTLGRLVLRLVEADSGSLTFDGHDLRSMGRRRLRAQRRDMQMIFQDPYSSSTRG